MKRAERVHVPQDLQAAFDRAHGLAQLGHGRPRKRATPSNVDLGAAQYAVLALCGETGELANALKKAIRAGYLGDDAGPALDIVRCELADIYAYLLKLASVMKVDLEAAYLETVALNCLRFRVTNTRGRPKLLGLAGDDAQVVSSLATHLVRTLPGKTGNLTIRLPAPNQGKPGRFRRWHDMAKRSILRRLSQSPRATHVIVCNDPAYHVQLQSHGSTRRRDPDPTLLTSQIELEAALWRRVSSRTLVVAHSTGSVRLANRLAEHGVHLIDPTRDIDAREVDALWQPRVK